MIPLLLQALAQGVSGPVNDSSVFPSSNSTKSSRQAGTYKTSVSCVHNIVSFHKQMLQGVPVQQQRQRNLAVSTLVPNADLRVTGS